MPRSLLVADETRKILVPEDADKDKRHRLTKFVAWMNETHRNWAAPDLAAYRDYLLKDARLSPESVGVHLSTVRSRYRELLLERRLFFMLVPPQPSFAEHKALADELIARIEAAIDPRAARLRSRSVQDRSDLEHVRLTHAQARALLRQPDSSTLAGIRDRAIIAMLLCTGIREAELCSLEVADLKQRLQGQLALHVRSGKGGKARLIPYGALDWCLPMVEHWLRLADIHDGPVFRGLRKGDNVRRTALNERTIEKILARYPIEIGDQRCTVEPHDCRRTYARWLYEAGVKVDGIRQNLGHDSIEMTFRYIGPPDIADRVPPVFFRP